MKANVSKYIVTTTSLSAVELNDREAIRAVIEDAWAALIYCTGQVHTVTDGVVDYETDGDPLITYVTNGLPVISVPGSMSDTEFRQYLEVGQILQNVKNLSWQLSGLTERLSQMTPSTITA